MPHIPYQTTLNIKSIHQLYFPHFCYLQTLILKIANLALFLYTCMSSYRESQVAENKIANLPDKPRSVKLFTTLLDENIRGI